MTGPGAEAPRGDFLPPAPAATAGNGAGSEDAAAHAIAAGAGAGRRRRGASTCGPARRNARRRTTPAW